MAFRWSRVVYSIARAEGSKWDEAYSTIIFCIFWSSRSVWVFLAPRCFAAKAPLMTVGFPWISLDSLARIEIFQWVTRPEAEIIFPRAFSLGSAEAGAGGRGHAEAPDCSWGKLTLVSDFLQPIVVRAVGAKSRFRRPSTARRTKRMRGPWCWRAAPWGRRRTDWPAAISSPAKSARPVLISARA